jgi:putative Mn2+ efflux pump MntP
MQAVQVFLSYAYGDKPLADILRRGLEDCGFRVWSDEPARPGESVSELIASGINAADAFVVVLGRNTTSRQWSMLEIGGAIASGKPIVPVLIDRGAEVPRLLSDRQYLDFSDRASRPQKLAELCEAVRRAPTTWNFRTGIELVASATDALRLEADEYTREARARDRRVIRLQLIAMVLSVVSAAVALLVASFDATAIVAAIAAGTGALLAATVGFHFGSARAPDRGSDSFRDRR